MVDVGVMGTVEPPAELVAELLDMGVADHSAPPAMRPLAGGVSSDIWLIDVPGGPLVAKQALARLKVSGDWRARCRALATRSPGCAAPRRSARE